MIDFSVSQLNEVFLQALDNNEMKKEAQERGAEYLKLAIYEDSFHERIMPAQSISPMMCDRDVNSPNYQVVIDKEFVDVKAVTATLRGKADYEYVETDRYAVKFHKIESPEYALMEGELRGMRQPVQNLIRHHIAYYIRKEMDRIFIGMSNAAVAESSLHIDLSAGTDTILTPEILVRLRNLIDGQNQNGRYLRGATLLMTHSMFNYVSTWIQSNTGGSAGGWTGVTSGIGADFWKDGYNYDSLFGLRVVKTFKSDLVKENEIYIYTEPEYLGHHFTFNDDRFSIEKRHDEIKWKGFRTYGAAFGNVQAVGKLTLKPIPRPDDA